LMYRDFLSEERFFFINWRHAFFEVCHHLFGTSWMSNSKLKEWQSIF